MANCKKCSLEEVGLMCTPSTPAHGLLQHVKLVHKTSPACRMIAAGDVKAVIDEEAAMVRFTDDIDGGAVSVDALHERMAKVADMQKRLLEASRTTQLEPKYVSNLLRQDVFPAAVAVPGAAMADVTDLPTDAMDDS